MRALNACSSRGETLRTSSAVPYLATGKQEEAKEHALRELERKKNRLETWQKRRWICVFAELAVSRLGDIKTGRGHTHRVKTTANIMAQAIINAMKV